MWTYSYRNCSRLLAMIFNTCTNLSLLLGKKSIIHQGEGEGIPPVWHWSKPACDCILVCNCKCKEHLGKKKKKTIRLEILPAMPTFLILYRTDKKWASLSERKNAQQMTFIISHPYLSGTPNCQKRSNFLSEKVGKMRWTFALSGLT